MATKTRVSRMFISFLPGNIRETEISMQGIGAYRIVPFVITGSEAQRFFREEMVVLVEGE